LKYFVASALRSRKRSKLPDAQRKRLRVAERCGNFSGFFVERDAIAEIRKIRKRNGRNKRNNANDHNKFNKREPR